ncbi:hypothetical protein BH09MYX1_BH09MYX1_14530 [soil metagenome]
MSKLRFVTVVATSLLAAACLPLTPDSGNESDGGASLDDAKSAGDASSVPSPQLKALSAGSEMTCAVLVDGTVRCFGRNSDGQLGNGVRTTEATVRPVQVVGISDAIAVSAGVAYACALRAGGTVVCWGSGAMGLLGNGTTDDALAPTAVANLSGVVEIATGYASTCALEGDGTVWCWGRGGEIGSTSGAGSNVPLQVAGLSGISHLANANEGGTSVASLVCARRNDGAVLCFSSENLEGQLGIGTQDPSRVPVAVSGIGDATQITASLLHSCAVRADGTYCWGAGQLVGDGTIDRRLTPVRVTTTLFSDLSSGLYHTCGREPSGAVSCWGETKRGQVGDGQPIQGNDVRLAPTKTLVTNAELLSAGEFHTCAYTKLGKTLCWGANAYGELGSGETGSFAKTSVPTEVRW